MDDSEFKEQLNNALNKSYFYLKFRPRTEKEVRDYLLKKAERYHWPRDVVVSAIEQLKSSDFINDKKFVTWFVDQRNRTKPKSAFALRNELFRLGISKDLIDEYFSETESNEEELAYEALRSKWHRFASLDKRRRFQKAAAFLSRRGFSFDSIKKAVNRLQEDS